MHVHFVIMLINNLSVVIAFTFSMFFPHLLNSPTLTELKFHTSYQGYFGALKIRLYTCFRTLSYWTKSKQVLISRFVFLVPVYERTSRLRLQVTAVRYNWWIKYPLLGNASQVKQDGSVKISLLFNAHVPLFSSFLLLIIIPAQLSWVLMLLNVVPNIQRSFPCYFSIYTFSISHSARSVISSNGGIN